VIINLSDANKEVIDRHEAVMGQLMSGEPKNQNIPGLDSILRGEILRKDGLIRQLMDQNKMLLNTKERQEVEVAALNETLEEQRAHIQFLGSTLQNAESNVVRLEEENRLKEGYAERVKQMTRSLDQLQKASEKREAMEKKLRAKLEDELMEFRQAQTGNTDPNLRPGDSIEEFRRKLSEAEEKIIRLESERTQWEQRYLEETAMRQVAIDAASIPKDAKIAALEKTSAESEKLIADARNDKMRQFEDMQNAQRKCCEMDTAIKTLETSLAERNAAIRILQSKNSASLNMSVNNIDEILAARMGVATAGTPATPSHQGHQGHQGHAHILAAAQAQAQQAQLAQAQLAQAQEHQNILNIPILNSQHSSPHKKQFSMPSVLATPPQYHSLNLSKKLGHTQHRSLTPSADMFLGSQRQQQAQHSATEYIRSATPSADILRAAPNAAEHMGQRATPSSQATNADIMRAAEILRATPTSELHRLSAPADMLRGTPIEMLRGTPTHEMLRGTPTHEIFRGGNHQNTQNTAVNMATANEMLRQHQQNIADHMMRATPTEHMMRATPTDHIMRGTPTDHLMRGTPTDHMMRATPTGPPNLVPSGGLEPSHKRREPSGTSTGDSFQHPGPTLINTADLYNPSLVGGTMPKMSMLREHKSPLSSKIQPTNSANVSGNNSNFFDDSIGSFLGPASTASSSTNIRHEATKSYDGSKSYMEVWRV